MSKIARCHIQTALDSKLLIFLCNVKFYEPTPNNSFDLLTSKSYQAHPILKLSDTLIKSGTLSTEALQSTESELRDIWVVHSIWAKLRMLSTNYGATLSSLFGIFFSFFDSFYMKAFIAKSASQFYLIINERQGAKKGRQ